MFVQSSFGSKWSSEKEVKILSQKIIQPTLKKYRTIYQKSIKCLGR